MVITMQTVVETPAYLKMADKCGLSEKERSKIVSMFASDPIQGVVIEGSGGCRKVRIAGRGRGKSGGYRVVAYYASDTIPVYLLAIFSKGVKDNLSNAEVNALHAVAKNIVAGHRRAPVRRA